MQHVQRTAQYVPRDFFLSNSESSAAENNRNKRKTVKIDTKEGFTD